MERKNRYVYLDALRIIACLCVIYIHINERGQFMFAYRELASIPYFLEMFLSILSKMAVPVFFAISGALLLGKEISLKTLFIRRIFRMGAVLVLFSAISCAVAVYKGDAQWSVKAFILGMYESTWNFTYWYLYAYLAFLLISPILGSLVRQISRRDYLYLLTLAFVFRCLLPAFEQLRWEGLHQLNPDFSLACITCDIVFYPCLGYFLHHSLEERHCRRAAWTLCAAALAGAALSCYMTYRETTKVWVMSIQKYHDLFAPVYCAAVFAAAKCICAAMDTDRPAARWITAAARYTFGVYLLHLPVLQLLESQWTWLWNGLLAVGLPQVIASAAYCMAVFGVCAIPVWLLKRIPLVKTLLA
ncbi:MAG: acyltransferase [Clostridiales bacterium]|nr:acyltransferase [Clostridiales bacterium]